MAANHFDVLIIGAGLSGINAAVQLERQCPGKRYAILEARAGLGGTWDLFRYPGIRSDSDVHTMGYRFNPFHTGKLLASGSTLLNYLKKTAAEQGVDQHIRYRHKVKKVSWSTEKKTWKVYINQDNNDVTEEFTCNFLWLCAGYYSYEQGYTPEFAGRADFTGPVIHPQEWTEEIEFRGKTVVVIGSGATAVTMVPAMAEQAKNVIMLQRSPSYFFSFPEKDWLGNTLQKIFPGRLAYGMARRAHMVFQQAVYRAARRFPKLTKRWLIRRVRKQLGTDYDVTTHFTPAYEPWEQRVCIIPANDFFKQINAGKVDVVTDHIERFTSSGILLKSGRQLAADMIVTATGFELNILSDIDFVVDDKPVNFADTWTYKGLMVSDLPNMVNTFGYINATWTLRSELTADYVCRLINFMDQAGVHQVTPRLRDTDQDMQPRPFLTGYSSGYMQRSLHRFPKQGDREPWLNPQIYRRDKKMILKQKFSDGVLEFE